MGSFHAKRKIMRSVFVVLFMTFCYLPTFAQEAQVDQDTQLGCDSRIALTIVAN
jgi:hypothetical protein